MSLENDGKKRREQIKSLRSKRTALLKQRDLSMQGRLLAEQKGRLLAEQNNVGSLGEPYERYYTSVFKEARVDGVPGTARLIFERGTGNLVGEIENGIFENYGIPDATWDGETLEIGGKVFFKYKNVGEYVR